MGCLPKYFCHVITIVVPVFSSWKEVINVTKHKAKNGGWPCLPECNRHHIFFNKKEWLSSGVWAAKLRQCQWCIVVIDLELHSYITLKSPPVPIPPDGVIELVLYKLGRFVKHGSLGRETSLERRLEILVNLFKGAAPATAKALRVQLDAVREYTGSLG